MIASPDLTHHFHPVLRSRALRNDLRYDAPLVRSRKLLSSIYFGHKVDAPSGMEAVSDGP